MQPSAREGGWIKFKHNLEHRRLGVAEGSSESGGNGDQGKLKDGANLWFSILGHFLSPVQLNPPP